MARGNIIRRRENVRLRRHRQNIRNVVQCISNTLKQKQCKKRTARTKKCWIHLAKENNLRVKKSNIPNAGMGLFSWKKPFERNQKIAEYTGQPTTEDRLDRYYGKDVRKIYAVCNSKKECIDANRTTDGAPRYANDARNTRFINNSKLSAGKGGWEFVLKSKRKINPHQEILTNYGNEYWK